MASISAIRFRRVAGLLLLFGSGPGFVWSCSDAQSVPRHPPPAVIEMLPRQPVHRAAPVYPERENIQKKLDDLSNQIDQLKETVKARKAGDDQ